MLVGILSDSHGRYLAVRQAMAFFDSLGVGHVIHCGDIGGEEVFDEIVGRPCTFVWGNTDVPRAGIFAYLEAVGIEPPASPPAVVTLDGKTIAIFHGHEVAFRQALTAPRFEYVLHGHTHLRRDERIGRTRVINPGALHRARTKTVATLDVTKDVLTFHEIAGA